MGKNSGHKKLGLKAYRRRRYRQAVSHLEKALKSSKDDPEIYLYLGYASLFIEDIDGARSYFKGGLTVDERNPDLMKGLAYIYLTDERVEDAISLWGEVLEQRPRDRSVRRALEGLRGADDVVEFVRSLDVRAHLSTRAPLLVRLRPYLLGISITAGILVVFAVFYFTPLYQKTLEKFYPDLVRLNQLTLPAEPELVQEEGSEALYSFTDQELRDSFARIKRHIYREKINTAIIALNRIMLSNATPLAKERFEILYTFINPPDPLNVDYVPRLYEIMREPAAFRGVYLVWKGRIANLQKEEGGYSFDLLVNYEDEETIEGIAHVTIQGTYHLESRRNVEVFGTLTGVDRQRGVPQVRGILLKDLRL
ncbi:MAG: tetratricopeptide repeat protein [Spirochaetota bacterium]